MEQVAVKEDFIQVSTSKTTKKEKIGRWTASQKYLFETLLQKYGKNWKKIGSHLPKRTLSQIRSHAQKYFEKLGEKKMAQLQQRAKVLGAFEILTQAKCLPETKSQTSRNDSNDVKIEELESMPIQDDSPIIEKSATPLLKVQPRSENPLCQTSNNIEIENAHKYDTYVSPYSQAPGGLFNNIILTHPNILQTGIFGLLG